MPDYDVAAKKNNAVWKGTASMQLDKLTDTLIIWNRSNPPAEEVLGMKIKFEGAGTYILKNNQSWYYSTVGGDVIVSEYKLAENQNGKLIITSYDSTRNAIEGSFDILLKKKMSNPENNIDSLHFTDGKFRGKWIDQ